MTYTLYLFKTSVRVPDVLECTLVAIPAPPSPSVRVLAQ